jgi:hypothetical protein
VGGYTRQSRRRGDTHEAEANATGAFERSTLGVAKDRRSVEWTAARESVAK